MKVLLGDTAVTNSSVRPKGYLCVADCSAGDPCLQTCQTMNYKGGYCSNGFVSPPDEEAFVTNIDSRSPSCVCSNDDPTA